MSTLLPHLFDPSGGLPYHLRALRWRHRLWTPFHAQVAAWLQGWQPDARHLVLVGPSGGYALTAEFLGRFSHITVLEPDPVARLILRRRFPAAPLQRGHLDALDLQHAGPAQLAARFRDAAILFCNVLGQVADTDDTVALCARLRRALQGHDWASFHDLLSANAPPTVLPQSVAAGASADAIRMAGLLWRGQREEITDHGTAALADHSQPMTLWQLAPGRWHVVGWVQHDATGRTHPHAKT